MNVQAYKPQNHCEARQTVRKGIVIRRDGEAPPLPSPPKPCAISRWLLLGVCLILIGSAMGIRHLYSQLEATKKGLTDVTALLDSTQANLGEVDHDLSLVRSRSAKQSDDMRNLQTRHYRLLVDSAASELLDPQTAKVQYSLAETFAIETGLSADAAVSALKTLPHAHTLPGGSQVEILSARYSPPALVIDFVPMHQAKFIENLSRVDVELTNGNRRLRFLGISKVVLKQGDTSVAVLFDTSGSTEGEAFQQMQKAGLAFCYDVSKSCPLRLWQFADQVRILTEWTSEGEQLQKAINSMKPVGATRLHAVLQDATTNLAMRPGEKVIVLFTDGRDSDSTLNPQNIIDFCRSKGVCVHCVALHTKDTDEPFLRRLALDTGGTYVSVAEPGQLMASFKDVADRLMHPAYRIVALDQVDTTKPVELRIANLPSQLVTLNEK